MAQSLDFSLPQAPRPRSRPGFLQALTFLVALATLALVVLGRWRPAAAPAAATEGGEAEASRLEKLAESLEKRTLYVPAAEVWGEYLAAASLDPEKKGQVLYRRGKCLKEGGDYAAAARLLTEADAFPLSQERKREARRLVLECFSALGKNEVREDLSRAFAVGVEEQGTVVARVGKEDITREELRADLTEQAEEFLKHEAQAAPLTPAERAARAAEIAAAELKDPERARAVLMGAISSRLLYREGLERGFAGDAAIGRTLERFRRQLVANRVVESEIEKAMQALGATELKNHYEAHRERFVEPAGVEFSFARLPGAAEAAAALEKLRAAGARPEGAGVEITKAPAPAVAGKPLPGIGQAPELAAHVLALGEGEWSDRPLAHAGAFYLFHAGKKRPERPLAFEEAEPQVRADLAAAKRAEALKGLQELLGQKFQVEILNESLQEKKEGGEGAKEPEKPGAAAKDGAGGPERKVDAASSAQQGAGKPGEK